MKKRILGIFIFLFAISSTGLIAVASVSPATVDLTLAPGESVEITKTVTTPEIPSMPDIVFMSDVTGSMGSDIENVKANAVGIMSAVLEVQPKAQFAVAQYRDFSDTSAFDMLQTVTDNTDLISAAINSWHASGGENIPEANLNALYQIASGTVAGYRDNSTKIVVWIGDAPGHDPSGGHSLEEVIETLVGENIKVIAVSTGHYGLDSAYTYYGLDVEAGQATAITEATNGILLEDIASEDVSEAILEGLGNLPVTVTPTVVGCDPLDVVFAPSSFTVTSGDDAVFLETVTVPNDDTLQGTLVSCEVVFTDENSNGLGVQTINVDIPDTTAPVITLNGVTPDIEFGSIYTELGATAMDNVDGSFPATPSGVVDTMMLGTYVISYNATDAAGNTAEEVTRTVNVVDTTAPVVECIASYNPSGKNIPKSGEKENGPAINPDGFYIITTSDNVDDELEVFINGFGAYSSGDTVKITEAPGVTPREQTIGKDKMVHLMLNTDAVVTVTDEAGNTVSATCYVPPMPK